ncbi:hypothetical protein [Streptomyces tendae]|uniref:hypothetical protein n=1 Tax=Streptomyces tendae TaxID=1932 RepID=UPI00343F8FD2
MTSSRLTDAAGRAINEHDHVGGTTSGRYQTTITGPVLQTGKGKAKVLVTNRPQPGSPRAANGDTVWISSDRLFLLHTATEKKFTGYRSHEDGRLWTLANVRDTLFESPMVPARYTAASLRALYQGQIHAVWTDAPGPTAEQDRTVAYRVPGTGSVYCVACCHGGALFPGLSSDDLPDGGLCDGCGVDVLIPQHPNPRPAARTS